MIIDSLENAHLYYALHTGIQEALEYLRNNDTNSLLPGKYQIDGDKLFAIVQEYETLDRAGEQMESHRKYIDVHYIIRGAERVGHAILNGQNVSMPYNEEEDFTQYSDEPAFFTTLEQGMFMILYPTDLHMPSLHTDVKATAKKIVMKVAVER